MQRCGVELAEDSDWMCGDCSMITFIMTEIYSEISSKLTRLFLFGLCPIPCF